MSAQILEKRRSHFGFDVLTLVTGTALAQIISILASPIITRLYGPEAFGVLAVFISIVGILSVVACLRYEFAIVLPKSDEEAANVFGLCILLLTVISILLIPALILSQNYLEDILNAPELGPFLIFIPPMIFLSGAFLALNFWNTRTRHFHRLAIAQVTRSGSVTGIQLGVGLLGYASGGVLVGAAIIGQFVSTVVLGIQILKDDFHYFRQNISLPGMIAVLRQYSNFPKYDLWAAFMSNLSSSLPVFILSIYFSSTILGYYSFGLMVITLPLTLIGNAIGEVFFQRAAEAKNIDQQKLRETVEVTLKPLIFLSLFPTLILALIGPQLFGVVFGIAWQEAGNYARYLSFWIFITFIASPINSLFNIFQKQRFNLMVNIIQIILRVAALFIGAALLGNALYAIILFAFVGVITNGLPLLYLFELSDIPLAAPTKIFLKYFLWSIPFLAVIFVLQYTALVIPIVLVFITFVLMLLYYFIVIKNDADLKNLATMQVPFMKKIF